MIRHLLYFISRKAVQYKELVLSYVRLALTSNVKDSKRRKVGIWVRASRRKVAGSIPDGVIRIFH